MSKWLKKFNDMPEVTIGNAVLSTIEQGEVKDTVNTYTTAEDVCRAIYSGTYKGSYLLPVLPSYQQILGKACWVCGDDADAARKRQTKKELVFTVEEFRLMVDTAMRSIDGLISVISDKNLKRGDIFCK